MAANASTIPVTGTMTIAGHTFTVTEAAAPCNFLLDSISAGYGDSGGSSNVVISANGTNCAWTANSNSGFITITSGSSGSGNAAVSYIVAANPDAIAETGSMTIAEQTYTITEAAAPCAFALSSTNASYGDAGGSSNIVMTANGSSCTWTAVSNSGFITITSGSSGSGSGIVSYTVAANTSAIAQTGSITIAGQTCTVTEAAAPCSVVPSPISADIAAAGGSDSVTVTANGSNCTWTAVSIDSFVTITAGTNGTGNGTVSYTVTANSATARTGTMQIDGQTFTVHQAGATLGFEFTHVVQACKTKINKKTETTNTTCTVAFHLVVSNTGVTNTPKFSVLFWLGQGSNLNSSTGLAPLNKKVKALKLGKSVTLKVKNSKLTGDQAGTFIYATDTSNNLLASAEVPGIE